MYGGLKMNINNDMSINRPGLQQVNTDTKIKNAAPEIKEEKVQAKESDVTLTIGSKMRTDKEIEDIINENILSASSSFMDIAKAEDMIKNANMNILNNSDDAVMSQSKQSVSMIMELLK